MQNFHPKLQRYILLRLIPSHYFMSKNFQLFIQHLWVRTDSLKARIRYYPLWIKVSGGIIAFCCALVILVFIMKGLLTIFHFAKFPKNSTSRRSPKPQSIILQKGTDQPVHFVNSFNPLTTPSPPFGISPSPQSKSFSSQSALLSMVPTGQIVSPTTAQSSSLATPSNPSSNQQGGSSQTSASPSPNQQNQPAQQISSPIVIYFKDQNGQITKYVQPSDSPFATTWGRYVNTFDNYSIDYPSTWQLIKSISNGHEGISLYPPGVDPSSDSAPKIGLGWAVIYTLPNTSATNPVLIQPVTVNGANGTLYTQGAMGSTYIAGLFPNRGGYFGLISNTSSDQMVYIYSHMIGSLLINN